MNRHYEHNLTETIDDDYLGYHSEQDAKREYFELKEKESNVEDVLNSPVFAKRVEQIIECNGPDFINNFRHEIGNVVRRIINEMKHYG
jgi:hypothetical protein